MPLGILLVGTALLVVHNFSVAQLGDRRAAATSAAEKVAVDISTIGGDNAEQRLQSLSDESTSEFRRNLDQNSTTFARILREGRVSARANVTGAGVEHLDGRAASVLVAVSVMVVNSQRPTGELMKIRLRIRLEDERGRWLAAGVEAVP